MANIYRRLPTSAQLRQHRHRLHLRPHRRAWLQAQLRHGALGNARQRVCQIYESSSDVQKIIIQRALS